MAINNYDYKKIEIRFKQLRVSYFHHKGRYTGGRCNTNKVTAWRFKAIDTLLSFLSSVLNILKSCFV